MTTITISLPEDSLSRLQELAARFSLTPEQLALAGIEEVLSQPEGEFERVAQYVHQKNAELYRRLA